MPIYAYECNECHHKFDEYNKVKFMNETTCPKCQGKANKDFEASLPRGKGVVLNNELVTDFDGKGEKTYTRRAYRDKCKELGRSPDGLLF